MFLSVIPNAWKGYRKQGWSLRLAVWYVIRRMAQKLHLFYPESLVCLVKRTMGRWLVKNFGGYDYFDFAGAKIPWVDRKRNCFIYEQLPFIFPDTFAIPCLYADRYTKENVEKLDAVAPDGPYGYTEGHFDVSVKAGDVVIDAGAWIGDFSAYAASKQAVCYAFEPMDEIYALLEETARYNRTDNEIYIVPVKKGLSDRVGRLYLEYGMDQSGLGAHLTSAQPEEEAVGIEVTTIDDFVRENNLQHVDFIKADIEGAERDMLRGARETLKRFAPKLAICTYHLPDDPQVLEQIIKEANPAYTVIHLRHKLMAMVEK